MSRRQVTRRGLLRGMGLLGALGVAGTTAWSYPVAGETGTGDSYSVEDPLVIESFDGTELEASFYVPDTDGPVPAVLMTHGWGNTRNSEAVTALANLYASNGYAVLAYDSRGFGNSGGLVGVDGPNEIGDARRLITYLARRDEVLSDGDDPVVGMDGYSYAGGIQLRTAAVDDRLDAIIPRWAWNDLRFSNDPNGVIKWPWNYALYVSGIFSSIDTDDGGDGVPDLDPTFFEAAREAVATGEASAELREFWASRSPGPAGDLEAIETPTLLVGGWHDRLFTPNETFANYRGLRRNSAEARLLMYNGGHDLAGAPGDSDPAQLEFLAGAALRWFRRHLKGEPVPADQRLAPVTLYRESTGTFESYGSLPDGERTLSLRDAGGPGSTTLTPGEGGPATASFDFDVDRPVDLAGTGRLSLRVSVEGERAVLSAALARVDDEVTVLKDQVAVTQTDRPGVVELDLIGVEATLEAGETLRLLVGVDDGSLAPTLSPEYLSGIGVLLPATLSQTPLAPYFPADAPVTDGLYFDSPSAVTIHHDGRGESQLTLSTVDDARSGRGLGAGAAGAHGTGHSD